MRSLVLRRASEVCECPECVRAGITQPNVQLRATAKHPARWLHGRELARWLEAERLGSERVGDIAARLRRDLLT